LDTIKNGEKIATGYTPSSSWSSPAIANGMLYIGCNDWNIYCFTEGITGQPSSATSSDNVAVGHDLVLVVVGIATVAIVALFTASYANKKKIEKPTAVKPS
jgi:hypothetical protein